MANRCLLLKCSTGGGAGHKKFWTKQGGPRGWDFALAALSQKEKNHSKGAKDKRSGLQHSLKYNYYLLKLIEDTPPHKFP